mgnify:FL=1
MLVGIVYIKIYIPFSHSLKEKRKVVKSICAKVKNNFNVSIAEVDNLGLQQTISIGIAVVSNDKKHIESIIDKMLNFIESHTEGEIVEVDREIV